MTDLTGAVQQLDVTQTLIHRAMDRAEGVLEATFTSILGLHDSSALLTADVRRAADTALRAETGIHLLRPASALDPLGDIYLECATDADDVLNGNWQGKRELHVEALKGAVRTVLIGLLRALRRWERFSIRPDADDVRYAANVMVYRSVPTDEIAGHALSRHLRLEGTPPNVDAARGVLELRTDLAMVLHRDRREPDRPLADDGPLALLAPSQTAVDAWPRPGDDDPDARFTVLPGAPIAFGLQDADVFQGAHDIETWLRDRYTPGPALDADPEMGPRLREYFGAHHIGSIYSQFIGHALRPLADAGDTAAHPFRTLDPLGVVNAHLDRPRVLPDAALAGLFAASAQPLRQLLGRLLSELLRQEAILDAARSGPAPPDPE